MKLHNLISASASSPLLTVVIGTIIFCIFHPTRAATFVTRSQLDMTFLGIADGKSYFCERSPERTWQEAKDYCKSFDLELATIESENQAELLNKTLESGQNYWTSGKELISRRPSNITWDGSESELNSSLLPSWYWNATEYNYCATVKVISINWNRNSFEMDMRSCLSKAHTLCQCKSPVEK